jgi:hypothetical protein
MSRSGAVDDDREAFLRALRADYRGEILGEVEHHVLALVALRRATRAKAREFAAAEVATRRLVEAELAKHGVVMGSQLWVRSLAWTLLLPVKLLLPTRASVALAHGVYSKSVASFERQQRRFGARNPELFAWLVEHEVRQRDWARDYLAG